MDFGRELLPEPTLGGTDGDSLNRESMADPKKKIVNHGCTPIDTDVCPLICCERGENCRKLPKKGWDTFFGNFREFSVGFFGNFREFAGRKSETGLLELWDKFYLGSPLIPGNRHPGCVTHD